MKSKCLVVLGMHRSGTSALAGMLGLLGAETSSTLLPAHPDDNPRGYWENADIVAIHDKILASFGSSWHDERKFPPQWWLLPELEPLREELIDVIQRDYSSADLWMVKDPRLCRMMPLWSPILDDVADEAKVIMIVRHPHEVAESLNRRDGISHERAYLLWFRYMQDAAKWSRAYPSVLVSYEQLLSDWRAVIGHVVQKVDVPISYNNPLIEKEVDLFLEPQLRHNVAADELRNGRLLEIVQSIYHSCLGVVDLTYLSALLSPFEDEINAITDQLRPLSDEIQSLRCSHSKLVIAHAELVAKHDRLVKIAAARGKEITRIKSTVSWHVTKPLRFLNYLIRKLE